MKYNDFELLELIEENDEVAYDILLKKYKPIIYSKALDYYTYLKNNNYTGFSLDDFIEEGIVALNHAIKKFDPNKGSIFYSFVLVCLTSHFNLMFRDLFRQKERPLLKYQELDYEVRDFNSVDPYDHLDNLENISMLKEYLYSISLVDSSIILLRLNNFKYCEIASLLEVSNSKICRTMRALKNRFNLDACKMSKNTIEL